MLGIDVSSYQSEIDWAAFAAGSRNNDFAYVKATDGRHVDSAAVINVSGFAGAKVPVGIYHFFRPAVNVHDQITNFYNSVESGRKYLQLLPVLDLEETGSGLGDEWLAVPSTSRLAMIQSAIAEVKAQFGQSPILYTRYNWLTAYVPNYQLLAGSKLWVAGYGAKAPEVPRGLPPWTIWQYSSTGQVDGISTPVDLDQTDADSLASILA